MGIHNNETLCSVKGREFMELLCDISSVEELFRASV